MQEGSRKSALGVFQLMEMCTLLMTLTEHLRAFFLPTCCPVSLPVTALTSTDACKNAATHSSLHTPSLTERITVKRNGGLILHVL